MNGSSTEGRPALPSRGGWKFPNAFSVVVVLLLAANYFSPFADLDFTWQIHTGEEILRTGRAANARTPSASPSPASACPILNGSTR